MNNKLFSIFLSLLLFSNTHAQQKNVPGNEIKLNSDERNKVIDTLVWKINNYYVFPDMAKKMTDAIRRHQLDHDYDTVTDGASFARLLTAHLKEINKDGHLGVDYSATPVTDENPGAPTEEVINEFRQNGARNNYNFRKAERLDGNIGLLQLDAFYPADWIKETASGAMAFLSNADAIIIDLRNNHGFAPDGVILIESYFFKEETHITDQLDRDAKTTRQYWTLPTVPGPSLAAKDLYILTSNNTFSAGEDFAYNLQAQGRAKVIGETTGGGAHGTKPYRISKYFSASIPFSSSVNPITHGDWEGTGVKPNVIVPADQALLTAQIIAIRALISRIPAETQRVTKLEQIVLDKEKELNVIKQKTTR
jgi:hypothetical protein